MVAGQGRKSLFQSVTFEHYRAPTGQTGKMMVMRVKTVPKFDQLPPTRGHLAHELKPLEQSDGAVDAGAVHVPIKSRRQVRGRYRPIGAVKSFEHGDTGCGYTLAGVFQCVLYSLAHSKSIV